MSRSAQRLLAIGLTLACGVLAGVPSLAAEPETEPTAPTYGNTPKELVPYSRTSEPYRRFYVDPLLHRGPGRDEAEPEGLSSVRIGLLAPLERTNDEDAGLSLKRGVELALEQANAAGGYRGTPFELVTKNDQALWGSSGNTLIDLAYIDRVWAMIGSIDSNSTHVALRAALKAELPMVNVGSTDPTVTETGIPWLLRLTPDDRQTGYRLASHVFGEREFSRVAVIRASDRYGRFGVKEFRDAARRLARPLPIEVLIESGQQDLDPALERISASEVEAVVLWLKAPEAGRVVRRMRELGMTQPVVGTNRLVSAEFLELAGAAADGVVATTWIDPDRDDDARWSRFREAFRSRFEIEPDAFAAYAYDAAELTVATLRAEGLNRIRVRDALMRLRTYRGVTGLLQFDETSNNVCSPLLAHVEGGRFVLD